MTQFDVYHNPNAASRKRYPYLVDIQNPYLEDLATYIVVPLGNTSAFKHLSMKKLTPGSAFQGEELILLTPQISSMPKKQLKKPIGSLSTFREQLLNALDFAVFGI